jgi:hypothetical protein
MDLNTFKKLVDICPDEITSLRNDFAALYAYVGLPVESSFLQHDASEEIYRKISRDFTGGHQLVWKRCRALRDELSSWISCN